jgi:bifunctional non-homologous end joining protein LigD
MAKAAVKNAKKAKTKTTAKKKATAGASKAKAKAKSKAKVKTKVKTIAKTKTKAKAKSKASVTKVTKKKTSRVKSAETKPLLKEYNRKRDFAKTAEPEGAVYANTSKRLAFVVQKHEASHLHYDIRLEVEGVMKSWACPKGPSFDPSVKRLAVEVEDHPVTYNDFEGTIPSGEYGGGTVMIWDHGYYTVDDAQKDDDPEQMMLDGIAKGKLAFTFHGKKLRGSFALVRTRLQGKKAQWLLIKHRDHEANPDYDPVADEATSAKSAKTMSEIEKGDSPVYSAKASVKTSKKKVQLEPERLAPASKRERWGKSNKTATSSALMPMLIHTSPELPLGEEWVYEQKLDGVRLIAYVDEENVALISRLGNDKSKQFPELAEGLKKMAKASGGALVLDGEVVAVSGKTPLGFQYLQGRIHLDDSKAVQSEIKATPVEFYVFDLLLLGEDSLVEQTLEDRRNLLEQIFKKHKFPLITLTPVSPSAEAMQKKAAEGGWEGLIAKDISSHYLPGARTRNWLKWKSVKREELIIGGWTEPKGARNLIGSLLVGYYDENRQLQFAGHVGSGFNNKILKELHQALKKIEIKKNPFSKKPVTNDVPHWVEPELVAEIKFQEWTDDGVLRHPSFLGIRDDKRADDIIKTIFGDAASATGDGEENKETSEKDIVVEEKSSKKKGQISNKVTSKSIIKAIQGITESGEIELPDGTLRLTHLNKVIFPKDKITKRDLLEYYTLMADYVLPWMKDRPLVMRRFPTGIEGKDFYQQAPDEGAPGRIAQITVEDGATQDRFIGGDLITLLYLVQMSCVSYDPWHSRVQNLSEPDYSIIDLDPVAGTSFEAVRSIALAVLDLLDEMGLHGAMKTSGATGIHIYLPLPKGTSLEESRLLAEIICTQVADTHQLGTFERSVKKRKKGSVYLDSQQNFLSKSVAGVWAVRAKSGATVSTPITRKELEDGVTPQDFTIVTVIAEAKKRAAMWDKIMAKPNDLSAIGKKPATKKKKA